MATYSPSVVSRKPVTESQSQVMKGFSKVSRKKSQDLKPEKPNLFNAPQSTLQNYKTAASDGAPFSVEFALLAFEEQLFKCQLGEISHDELQHSFQDIQEKILTQINRQRRGTQ